MMPVKDVFILLVWIRFVMRPLWLLNFLQISFTSWGLVVGSMKRCLWSIEGITLLRLIHDILVLSLALLCICSIVMVGLYCMLEILSLELWRGELLLRHATFYLWLIHGLLIKRLLLELRVLQQRILKKRVKLSLLLGRHILIDEPSQFNIVLRIRNLLLLLPFIIILLLYNNTWCYHVSLHFSIVLLLLHFSLFDILEVTFPKGSLLVFIMFALLLIKFCRLMYKLLGVVIWLPSYKLPRVVQLIIVMIVLLLLNTLRWLPTASLPLVTTIPETLMLKSSVMLHHLLILSIIHLMNIGELRLLKLIRRRIIDDIVWRHCKSLLHLWLKMHSLRLVLLLIEIWHLCVRSL